VCTYSHGLVIFAVCVCSKDIDQLFVLVNDHEYPIHLILFPHTEALNISLR
jgi:hypothetical protein